MEEEEAYTLGHSEGCGCETLHVWRGSGGGLNSWRFD